MDLIYRYDPFQTIVVNRPNNAESAIRELLEGNRRLVNLMHTMHQATLGETQVEETVVPVSPVTLGLPFFPGAVIDQLPFAMVLGCSDARVASETIFDQGLNGMFVVRVAGNVLGTEGLGSFNYAVRHLGKSLQAVVVLGHTGCGAVTAAVDTYLSPSDYGDIAYTYALRSLLDRVMISVRGAAKAIERRCGREIVHHPQYRAALITVGVYLNAAINAYDLKREIATTGVNSLAVFYGACDLQTMLVTSAPCAADNTQPDLRSAPKDAEQLMEVGNQLVDAVIAGGQLK